MSRPTLKEGHVKFSDGENVFVFQLVDGINGLRESGSQPSTLNLVGGGERYGSFEPNFSHYEQRSWAGGRGGNNYIDDKTKFYDSQEAWTLGGEVFPAPKWRYAKGLRNEDRNLPDSMSWYALYGNHRYLSVSFSASASYNADKIYLWIRRRGTPGTLTFELCADNAGNPGTVLQTVTKTTADITDTVSLYLAFDWTSTQALTVATTYHIKIYGNSGDNENSHWEIGCDTTTPGKSSTTGSSWSTTSFSPCYRITDADISRKWMFFVLEGAMYIVSANDDGSASMVYIQGDRGTASSGTATSITDTGKTWVIDRYINAWVKIVGGTGMGQARLITDNDATSLTVSPAWNINPDSTSRYVIYKTPWFSTTSIGTTGLGAVTDVCVANNIAYFAQGSSVNMRRARNNANTHDWSDDGTNKADLLHVFYDAADGVQIWRAINGTTMEVSRASTAAWGTNLSFRTGISVGAPDYKINGLIDYNNALWVVKEDSLWTVQNDHAIPINVGLAGMPHSQTGQAMAANGYFLYFSWWKSMERLYGGTLDDEGNWKGEGMPSGRGGYYSAIVPLLNWIFCGIDAGTGTSSVQIYKDGSYHDVYRAPIGERVRNIFAQYNDETTPWVWINVGGDLVYQEYTLNPLQEPDFAFQHEAVIVSTTHDAGHAETHKFWKDLSATTENLNTTGINIECDFQTDTNVGTNTWKPLQTMYRSPSSTVDIGAGEVQRIRYRLRMNTNVSTTPPILKATILKGYEVLPIKRLWTMRIKTSTIRRNGKSASGDDIYDWIWDACQRAKKIEMETVIPGIDKVIVKLEPPSGSWQFINRLSKWVGQFVLTVREM